MCVYVNPNLPIYPSPLVSPVNHKFVFSMWLYFCFVYKFICTFFLDSTYKQYYIIYVFLCLTSLSVTISRFIHVAANGIILFFFMAE